MLNLVFTLLLLNPRVWPHRAKVVALLVDQVNQKFLSNKLKDCGDADAVITPASNLLTVQVLFDSGAPYAPLEERQGVAVTFGKAP